MNGANSGSRNSAVLAWASPQSGARFSQALYLFLDRPDLVFELGVLCRLLRIVAAQLIEYLLNGELVYDSHRRLLGSRKVLLGANSDYFLLRELI
jgi:hypothetical protein